MRRLIAALVLTGVLAPASAGATEITACAGVAARTTVPAIVAADPKPGAPRVFAMQFKQEARHVVSAAAFRRKIECLLQADVLPYLARGRPNVVVFNEDIGLMATGMGQRGVPAQKALAKPGATSVGVLSALNEGYAKQEAFYARRLGKLNPLSGSFTAATDTLVRGWMTVFSELARKHGIYLAGSGPLSPFVVSSKASDIALLAEPGTHPSSVFLATSKRVYNEAFLWAPKDVTKRGPAVLRNVVLRNRKLPLTPIEKALGFAPGPATGAAAVTNLRPYALPGTKARLGFATSLPAFVYGNPPAGTDPCSDTSKYYMRCLDKLGTNVVLQDEANPGAWTGADGDGIEMWQPLSWMTSTWRTAADPSVHFAYNVTPMLVGNLADLPFDGQSAITQRGGTAGPACHYVGNGAWLDGEDRPDLTDEAGDKREFVAMAPWVAPDGPRADLRAVGAKLAPGSGDPREDDYVETALVADLPFPVDTSRRGCVTAAAPAR